MGDMGDVFNAMKKHRQEKRSKNRDKSPEILTENGIEFESKNMGAHLVVDSKDGLIDFWPGTGKFIPRKGSKPGRGVFNLIKLCK